MAREFVRVESYKRFLDNLIFHSQEPRGRTIAIAGPRGVGKTGLLEELQKDLSEKGFFTCHFPCPKTYEPREFAISLYKEIVRKHVPSEFPFGSGPLLWSRSSRSMAMTIFAGVVLPIIALVLTLMVLSQLVWATEPPTFFPTSPLFITICVISIMFLLAYVYLLAFFRARMTLREFLRRNKLAWISLDLVKISRDRLRKIVYNEKITAYSGAEVRGIRFGRAEELSVRPFTDRELVDEFVTYVAVLCRHYTGTLICVDELDKISEPDDFRAFLTGVKDLFYMPDMRCLTVLSVSEDAVANYLTGIKDVVDSTFDEVYVFDIPSFETAVEIARVYLDERLQKNEIAQTIASIAGGLPRELQRAAIIATRHAEGILDNTEELPRLLLEHKLEEGLQACRMLRFKHGVAQEIQEIDRLVEILLAIRGFKWTQLTEEQVGDFRATMMLRIPAGELEKDFRELQLKILEFAVPVVYLVENKSHQAVYSAINGVKTYRVIPSDFG